VGDIEPASGKFIAGNALCQIQSPLNPGALTVSCNKPIRGRYITFQLTNGGADAVLSLSNVKPTLLSGSGKDVVMPWYWAGGGGGGN
jgi:hypothetical protein